MKISVLGREFDITILRQKERVIVVLAGGTWVVRETHVLRRAASELMETILAPLANAGDVVDMYLRSPAGWYQVKVEWGGLVAKSALPVQLSANSARVQWLLTGLSQRRAFVEMKQWLADALPA